MLQQPEMVVPHTRDAVLDVMSEARAAGEPLRIAGAGTWLDGGVPVESRRTLSLQHLTGITEYVPGDLTITALAGTSLAELTEATAAHGQWLGLDPAGSRRGTIGATIATASSGPLAHAFGTPRDLVLGLEAVTGYGEIVRPGGRVVKNVAGFDLVRLYTGAWGTLGPITSATLRLRALPVHDVTLAIAVPEPSHLNTLLPLLRANTLSFLAAEWLDGRTAATLGVGTGDDVILVRLGGNDRFVRGQRAVIDRIASVTSCDPSVWDALTTLDHGAEAVLRLSGSHGELPERIAHVRGVLTAVGASFTLHAGIGRGIVRVIVASGADGARDALQESTPGTRRIAERLPQDWWSTEVDPFADGLAGRIRLAFDPQLLCNRRLVTHA